MSKLLSRYILFAVMLMVANSTANAVEENPTLLDLLIRSQMEQNRVPSEDEDEAGGGNFRKITDTAADALIVFDRNCTQVVQPFELTDNFTVLRDHVVDETIEVGKEFAIDMVGRILTGQKPAMADLEAVKKRIPKSLKRAAQQLNWLPMTAEVMYGERLHGQEDNILQREHKLGAKYYPIADKMLKEILSKVSQKHDYEFKLFILKNSGGNAIARPGGFIYVDQGLIDDKDRHPKAYFALAHEVAHVLQRHETKELQSLVIDSIPDKELRNVISSAKYNPGVIFEYLKLRKDRFTRHHVDQELQSDSCAVKLLDRVFMNDQKLTNSIQVFLKDLENLPDPDSDKVASEPMTPLVKPVQVLVELVDTPIKRHPSTVQRTDNLKAIFGEIKGRVASSK